MFSCELVHCRNEAFQKPVLKKVNYSKLWRHLVAKSIKSFFKQNEHVHHDRGVEAETRSRLSLELTRGQSSCNSDDMFQLIQQRC